MTVKVLVAKPFPLFCEPMDSSPPGSSVLEILQGRILEWIAIPFSRGSSWPWDQTQVSHIADRVFTIWATEKYILEKKILENFQNLSKTLIHTRRSIKSITDQNKETRNRHTPIKLLKAKTKLKILKAEGENWHRT